MPTTDAAFLFRIRLVLTVLLAGMGAGLIAKKEWQSGITTWWSAVRPKLGILVEGGWWWGGLGVAILLAMLLVSSKWWARHWPAWSPSATTHPVPRRLILAIMVLMALGTALRAPRLGLSLYNDEAHVFRSHLAGSVPREHWGDPTKFRPVNWLSTIYENRAGNNAMPFSIASRASYDTWRSLTGTPQAIVSETALRLPVLICGVLSIGAMAWLGFRLGGPGLAMAAAILTTFHPWHMRYSVEARGYGLLMLAMPLLFIALAAALRTGRWRHWLAFGVMQYFTLACFFGAVWFVVALNLTLALLAALPLIRSRGKEPLALPLLLPAIIAGLTAASLYLLINFPLYLQLSKALANPDFFKSDTPFPTAWFQDVGGFLGFGIPGLQFSPAHPQPTVARLMGSSWGLATIGLTIVLLIAALLRGIVQLGKEAAAGTILAGAILGGAALTLAWCQYKGIVFLKWYPLFLLPGLILLVAAGFSETQRPMPSWRWLLLIPLLAAWAPGLIYYMKNSRENLRGAVGLARGVPYQQSVSNPHNTLYAVTWSETPVYENAAITLRDGAHLQSLIAQARTENRPLHVAFGREASARHSSAEVFALLDDPALFHHTASLPGMDEDATAHHVYELKPAESGGATGETGLIRTTGHRGPAGRTHSGSPAPPATPTPPTEEPELPQ